MITIRQIERLWTARAYERLLAELTAARPEGVLNLEAAAVPAAAMVLIRLEELSQEFVPIYERLFHIVLAAQEEDGGWGDPMTTALCLRALLSGEGQGPVVERGLAYLAGLQKAEGIWPRVPIRRMPADAFASAFVLFQLGDNPRFRTAVRFSDALEWFAGNQSALDADTRRLWRHAAVRCQGRAIQPLAAAVWS